ncbi:pyridoxal-phosphate dependent enzyme [Stenotrophomonas maltophilia]|uniref:Tryptophan synthase beta chain-like PALP domain-containing protein n=1 Tax=Knufia peltigerae TaxID=1002370 RepID=A0AA38Y0K1_9EURO|nr:hypothetical protein H2204_008150 [Knufia peltigerae]MBH1494014.1 pyridoxal-phosphate dependent enzyme [Stenotrophomonas maltophilia]MBN4961063.1 pyridoxal-phosphate dependent enzyme [Stenotrophomonas maltophilia]
MQQTVLNSVVEAIGNTPLIRLDRLVTSAGVSGTLLAKLEYPNPGFSKKDRAACGIVETATANDSLRPGQAVVELTSGNMGTGLAIACMVAIARRSDGHIAIASLSLRNQSGMIESEERGD